jgi:hypothetical protein
MVRISRVAAACLVSLLLAQPPALAQVRLPTLDNQLIDPLAPGEAAVVLVFISVDCPISNRYAPAVARLHDEFSAKGVQFWLVYPNPAETPAQIREHLAAYGYPIRALRDPKHELVKAAGVSITPEAVVYDTSRRMVYRGRIDDRYVAIGVERPAATRHDLREALLQTLAGQPVTQARLQAVGCYIADFLR